MDEYDKMATNLVLIDRAPFIIRNAVAAELRKQGERIERLKRLLRRLREWDHLDGAGDGPYWKRAISAALEDADEKE